MIPATERSHQSARNVSFETVDPNDPRLFIPSEDADPAVTKLRAVALFRLGQAAGIDMRKKAVMADDCQMYYASLFCKNGHALPKMLCFRCKHRFADCCCEYNLKVRIAKRAGLIEQIEALDLHREWSMAKFTIRIPIPERREAISSAKRNLRAYLEYLMTKAAEDGRTAFYEFSINGYMQGALVVTVVLVANDDRFGPHAHVEQMLEAHVVLGKNVGFAFQSIVSPLQVQQTFAELYHIHVPKSPERQAALEVLFHGLPLNDQNGVNADSFLLQPEEDYRNEERLSVEEVTFDPSTPADQLAKEPKEVPGRCLVCHERAAFVTAKHLHSATAAEIANLPRYPLSGSPPN